MIILDTNVASELTKAAINLHVQNWFDNLANQSLHLTSITVAEMRFGVLVLADGKRQRDLDIRLTTILSTHFAGKRFCPSTKAQRKLMHN